MVDGLDLDDNMAGLMWAVMKGYAVGEIEYWPVESGLWGVRRIHIRHANRFGFDLDRGLFLLKHELDDGMQMPLERFIVARYRDSGENPYGVGIGRVLWWPYWFKKHNDKWWAVFNEKFGMPTVWAKHPPRANPEDIRKLEMSAESVNRESVVTTADNEMLELLEAARSGSTESYDRFATYMEDNMAKRILGQTADLAAR